MYTVSWFITHTAAVSIKLTVVGPSNLLKERKRKLWSADEEKEKKNNIIAADEMKET